MKQVWIISATIIFIVALFVIFSPVIKKTLRPEDELVKIAIPQGATFAALLSKMGIATSTANQILENSKNVYDFSKIVSGREMAFTFANADGALRRLVYAIDSEEQVTVVIQPEFKAEVSPIPYKIETEEVSGIIQTSLYESFLENNLDVRLALALAEMFAWQVDFAADIRAGDSFKVIYEKRFLEGEYVMPGQILAAKFINDEKEFKGYYFTIEKTKAAYYVEDGN